MKKTSSSDFGGLVASLLLVGSAAVAGNFFSNNGASQWYQELAKPGWTPPPWVFGPVWTILYALIALSAWLVWLERDRVNILPASVVFLVQLVLNALWSVLFFGLRRPDLALVEILLLLGVIIANVAVFWRVRRAAGLLLVPYLVWVGFATLLNFAIWRMNAPGL